MKLDPVDLPALKLDAASPQPWDDGDPLLEGALVRVRALPNFADAVRTLAGNMLALHQSDRAIAGVFKDAGRYVAAMVAVSMRRDGVTLARLKQVAASFGLLSPGRAYALLAYLRYLGYVELRSKRSERGRAIYRVSREFIVAWRDHLIAALEAGGLIDPLALDVARNLDDVEWLDTFTNEQMQGLRDSLPALADMPAIASIFLDRAAGSPLLWTFITESDWTPIKSRPVQVSAAHLAARFYVSKMHVTRIMRDAEKAGLLARPAPGIVELTPLARAQIERLYGMQLARLLVTCERARLSMQSR